MENGDINFYTNVGNAKNRIQTFGDAIIGLDSTRDGKYLLATCEKYLILLPTSDSQGNKVTLFQKQVKIVDRRKPFKLKLKPDDIFKYKL
jgi:VID27 C-terminal WD40-like domain